MTEWFHGDAVTVKMLREALAGLPDDAEVGTAILDVVGYVSKVTRIVYDDENKVLVFDSDKHVGAFTDEEPSVKYRTVATVFEGS